MIAAMRSRSATVRRTVDTRGYARAVWRVRSYGAAGGLLAAGVKSAATAPAGSRITQ